MKKLLIITALALLLPAAGLCWTVTDALRAVVAAKNETGGGGALSCPETITKFLGYGCDGDTDNTCIEGDVNDGGWGSYSVGNDLTVFPFVTPAGDNLVCSIEFYGWSAAGTLARLAVYDASNNLVCQGSASVAMPGDSAWTGHVGSANLTGDCSLSGSTNYRIVVTQADSNGNVRKTAANTANGLDYCSSCNYTASGFPDPITLGSSYAGDWSLRMGLAQ